jgi:superfamily II DNA or RNA helicase
LNGGDVTEGTDLTSAAVIKRWERGGPRALSFTDFFGFPKEFAGDRDGPYRLVAKESVLAQRSLPELHDYQKALLSRMVNWLNDTTGEDESAILVLPTGTGKTRVAGELLVDHFATRHRVTNGQVKDVVLWIAHTRELCEQAHETIEKLWTYRGAEGKYLNLYRFWSDIDVGVLQGASGCVIAGVQKLYETISDDEKSAILNNYLSRRLRLVVIDEAHLADNVSYQRIIDFFSQSRSTDGRRRWKLLAFLPPRSRAIREGIKTFKTCSSGGSVWTHRWSNSLG